MSAECYPLTALPLGTALYRDYLAMADEASSLHGWYGAELAGGPFAGGWIGGEVRGGRERERLADALERQTREFGGGSEALANVGRLRAGARAVVTGQQVGLLGGPLLVLLKAATAVARAREATARSGIEHVPVFWMATEDHDLAEVDQVSLLTKTAVETRSAGLRSGGGPVGAVELGGEMGPVLDWAEELLGYAPITEVLRRCYGSGGGDRATLGGAFARYMSEVFAAEGLVVVDAAGRGFHALGAATLRYAIEHAEELERALVTRSEALEAAGYHAQVKVAGEMSLLFLISDAGVRQALRRTADGQWKAGRQSLSTAELLQILDEAPERISPNALLRPVFQDTILPTAAYVGGPAEVAYWAQSAVVYEAVLGRVTPVLPRLTATLLEPAVAAAMAKDEVELPEALTTADALALRLGARAMPIELKRRLAAAGNALEGELGALVAYVAAIDVALGRSAEVSGSKMRYQMNRLRRMMARHEVEREASLAKHAAAITLNVYPDGHLQERVVAGAWYLARYEGLVGRLVDEARGMCGGHAVIRL